MSTKTSVRGETYTEADFFPKLEDDMLRSRASIKLVSPFASLPRIEKLEMTLFSCVQAGVRVCVFLQEPSEWSRPREKLKFAVRARIAQLESLVSYLRELGVHVNLVPKIHVKLAIIDDSILWDGSLNILSQNSSAERMTRWVDPDGAANAARLHKLGDCDDCILFANTDSTELALTSENLGMLIATHRRSLKMSKTELARLTGLTRHAIEHIESGVHQPKFETLAKLAAVFDCSLALIPSSAVRNIEQLLSRLHANSNSKTQRSHQK